MTSDCTSMLAMTPTTHSFTIELGPVESKEESSAFPVRTDEINGTYDLNNIDVLNGNLDFATRRQE